MSILPKELRIVKYIFKKTSGFFVRKKGEAGRCARGDGYFVRR